MKKRFLTAAILTGLAATSMTAQAEIKTKWFGFAQITLNSLSQDKPDDGFVFGADRVRFGFKVKDDQFFAKLQADLNKTDSGANNGTLPEIIKDIVVGWKFSKAAKVSLGQFKTPLGMDFNTSGKKLDITKRGMEKGLVLERAAGAMISGRKIGGGFGYDVFYGNPAGRSKADPAANVGSETTAVVNVRYDMGKMMHMELAYGVAGASAASAAEDYEVIDFGFKFKSGPSTAKFEYIDGTSVSGVKGNDETVFLVHYGHMVSKTIEVMARYYDGTSSATGAADLSLSNTYLGVNFYTGSNKTNGRIQLNYVLAGGDTAGSVNEYSGASKGYMDDAILTQYQVSF